MIVAQIRNPSDFFFNFKKSRNNRLKCSFLNVLFEDFPKKYDPTWRPHTHSFTALSSILQLSSITYPQQQLCSIPKPSEVTPYQLPTPPRTFLTARNKKQWLVNSLGGIGLSSDRILSTILISLSIDFIAIIPVESFDRTPAEQEAVIKQISLFSFVIYCWL